MKKIITLVLCLCLLITALPLSVSADENFDGAYDAIVKGVLAFEERIYIDQYNISTADFSELFNVIVANEPLLFNMKMCYYGSSGTKVAYMRPEYAMTQEEYNEAMVFVNAEVEAILATIPEGLDDYETALYLHDYIALNFCYDLTYTIRTIYDFLKEKTGVCAAYTFLYDELLTRIGIENYAVRCQSLNHVWNEIKINGNWYHVDITWDDPVGSTTDVTDKGYYARAWHDDFLCSDDKIFATHATDIVTKYACTDKSFDNLSWKNSYYPVGFANGNVYVLNDDNISLLDIKTDNTTAVFDADYEMHRSEINGRYYMNLPYFGSYDNKLIYHNGESILAFDPLALTAKTLETPVTDNKITLLYVSGNTVNYIIGTSDTKAEGEFKTLVLTKGLAGDIDGNGELSALDYIMLKRAVMSGIELSVSQDIWDVNADGLFSLLDYITLKRVVMGTYVLN